MNKLSIKSQGENSPGKAENARSNLRPSFTRLPGLGGRLGTLRVVRGSTGFLEVDTPILYPVVNLVTGTTSNGGGIWGYLCDVLLNSKSGEQNFQFLDRQQNEPIMTEALHFLEFGVTPRSLQERWLARGTVRDHYRSPERQNPRVKGGRGSVSHTAPMFVDSGGYRLLRTPDLELQRYGLLQPGQEAESILRLQQAYGADIVATLDYPLPPNLDPFEAEQRIARSTANALTALRLVHGIGKGFDGYSPFVYLACHGLNPGQIEAHVRSLFLEVQAEGLPTDGLGIAIGSLVPLRSAGRVSDMVDLILGAIRGAPSDEDGLPIVPVHVFGVSGDLIPLLVYLGVDSFDSSTYVQQSRTRSYYHPNMRRFVHLSYLRDKYQNLDSICSCPHCADISVSLINSMLVENNEGASYAPTETGEYKSRYYAIVALHNLYWERRMLAETVDATKSGALEEYLTLHAASNPRLLAVMRHAAALKGDSGLGVALEKVSIRKSPQARLPGLTVAVPEPVRPRFTVSMRFTPDSFNIADPNSMDDEDLAARLEAYVPPQNAEVLLLLPCSATKPYGSSQSQRAILRRLERELGECAMSFVHKVTLSGLYGPVPVELENEEPVLRYDFLLTTVDHKQIDGGARRVCEYVRRWREAGRYPRGIVGYAPIRAYRELLQQAQKYTQEILVLPNEPLRSNSKESEYLSELASALKRLLSPITEACQANVQTISQVSGG